MANRPEPKNVTIKNFPKSAGPLVADALEPKPIEPAIEKLYRGVRDVEAALLALRLATTEMLGRIGS